MLMVFCILSTLVFILRDETLQQYYDSIGSSSSTSYAASNKSSSFVSTFDMLKVSESGLITLINNDSIPNAWIVKEERNAYDDIVDGLWGVKAKEFQGIVRVLRVILCSCI